MVLGIRRESGDRNLTATAATRPPPTSPSGGTDLTHLTRTGLLRPAAHVHSPYRSCRSHPAVAVYRRGNRETLLAHPRDGDAIRATPKGRRSPLAALLAQTAPRARAAALVDVRFA